MTIPFSGDAAPLDDEGVGNALETLGLKAPELWAVLAVETRACGFLPDGRPAILFERHKFHDQTNGRFDATHPEVSAPSSGGYGEGGAHQYERLAEAQALDETAALKSASWGLGQVMGFNFSTAGYASVQAMIAAMTRSEDDQLLATAHTMAGNGWHKALRQHDWATFARSYNGPSYRANNYDVRLAGAYSKFASGGTPDLVLRAAQVYLTYLGLAPGAIDGVMGRFTRSALNAFQTQRGLPLTDGIDPDLLGLLRQAAQEKRALH
ncbi:N-acetylmuramidase domain-containing protein [Caballeronia cordobensis]|uniref:N-acetylmuramidase domain-containing protein n=1 Tax=Caballeronia cordobensis TaxID=1353886 RepID=UPI00045EDF1C|nr:peptidoglycan binding domain-containing protein [Burkholderia sp. RPE67]